MPACAAPELPPLWELEQGCHVWFDDGSQHGVSSSVDVDETMATVQIGGRELDGPTWVRGGDIAFRDNVFGHFDGVSLTIERPGIFGGEYAAVIEPASSAIHLDGGSRSIDLQRGSSCTATQAALGAAAVYLAFYYGERRSERQSHLTDH